MFETEDRSIQSLVNVFGKQPHSVWILKDDVEGEVPLEQVQSGDILALNVGEMVPADGTIIQGVANIDQRALTGESQPVEKEQGDAVFAATILLSGCIHVQVEKAGDETVAAQIGHILNHTALLIIKRLSYPKGRR